MLPQIELLYITLFPIPIMHFRVFSVFRGSCHPCTQIFRLFFIKHLHVSTCSTRLKFLLEHFAEEGEDEEREDGAPDEGVEDHERPPEDALGGGAEGVGDGVAGLSEEAALEEQEEDKVDDAERNVCE